MPGKNASVDENETDRTAIVLEKPAEPKRVPTHVLVQSQENRNPRKRGLPEVAANYEERIRTLRRCPQPLTETDSLELRRLQRDLQSLKDQLARWVLENVGEQLGDLFENQAPTLTPVQHQFMLQKLEIATLASRSRRSDTKMSELTNEIAQLNNSHQTVKKQLSDEAEAAKLAREELEAEKKRRLKKELELEKERSRVVDLEKTVQEQKQEIQVLKNNVSQQEIETVRTTNALRNKSGQFEHVKQKLLKTQRDKKNQLKKLRYWTQKCIRKHPYQQEKTTPPTIVINWQKQDSAQ